MPAVVLQLHQFQHCGVHVDLAGHAVDVAAAARVEHDKRRVLSGEIVAYAQTGGVGHQSGAVLRQALVVAGDHDEHAVVVGAGAQVVDKRAYGMVGIVGRGHVVGQERGYRLGEVYAPQMLGQAERRVARVRDNLHIRRTVGRPYLAAPHLALYLVEEGAVGQTLARAGSLGELKVGV